MGYQRVRGAVKNAGLEELALQEISKRIAKYNTAGELPNFTKKFDALWKVYPGNMRDRRDRGEAILAFSELNLGDFITAIENFVPWCQYWRSREEKDRRYIPRLHNWIRTNDFKRPAPPPGSAYRRDADGNLVLLPSRIEGSRGYPSRLSDGQTATLGEDGQYRVKRTSPYDKVLVPKSEDAPINNPLSPEECGDLQELADSLRPLL